MKVSILQAAFYFRKRRQELELSSQYFYQEVSTSAAWLKIATGKVDVLEKVKHGFDFTLIGEDFPEFTGPIITSQREPPFKSVLCFPRTSTNLPSDNET